MLWASDALGKDGKPAVLLLSVTRSRTAVTAELAYVAADLGPGPLPGKYYRSPASRPQELTLLWPEEWPKTSLSNRLHPRDTTPRSAVVNLREGKRVRLAIEGALSND